MSMQIAVIGANGYVGKHLCAALRENEIEVVSYSAGEKNGISLETGLLPTNFAFPQGLHTVFYLAQSPHYRQMPEQSTHLFSVNCIAAAQAAEAARKAGIKRFIYASTGNVYMPSYLPLAETEPVRRDNWYALSKVMAEEALILYRPYLDITVARIFGVYGPQQTNKLVPMIANLIETSGEVFVEKNLMDTADLDGLAISLMYIDDLVRAFVSLIDINDCEIINIAGTESVSIRTLATKLANAMKLPCIIKTKDTNRAFNLIANTTLQTALLGQPLISLTEGIQRFCEHKEKAACESSIVQQ